jgi:cysteine-rich repeat protein
MRLWLIILVAPVCGCFLERTRDYLDGLQCDASESTAGTSTGGTSTSGEVSEAGETSSSTGGTTAEDKMTSGTTDTGSTSTGVSGTTTGEPGPVCGNGVVEAGGPLTEECDDANMVDDDGCSATCARDLRAFVTSMEYQGGQIGSLFAADAQCANRADDAGLTDPLKFRAWLSDSGEAAGERIVRGRGRLVLVNGQVLAASWDVLLAGVLENPLGVTETSQTYAGGVWTGTNPDGTMAAEGDHCEDWANSSPFHEAVHGRSDALDGSWTYYASFNPVPCGTQFPIYCFEEP